MPSAKHQEVSCSQQALPSKDAPEAILSIDTVHHLWSASLLEKGKPSDPEQTPLSMTEETKATTPEAQMPGKHDEKAPFQTGGTE